MASTIKYIDSMTRPEKPEMYSIPPLRQPPALMLLAWAWSL
jgi:hypothetical protein